LHPALDDVGDRVHDIRYHVLGHEHLQQGRRDRQGNPGCPGIGGEAMSCECETNSGCGIVFWMLAVTFFLCFLVVLTKEHGERLANIEKSISKAEKVEAKP
jgi:hypothetical protein